MFECFAKVKIKLIFSYYFVNDKSHLVDKLPKSLKKGQSVIVDLY